MFFGKNALLPYVAIYIRWISFMFDARYLSNNFKISKYKHLRVRFQRYRDYTIRVCDKSSVDFCIINTNVYIFQN